MQQTLTLPKPTMISCLQFQAVCNHIRKADCIAHATVDNLLVQTYRKQYHYGTVRFYSVYYQVIPEANSMFPFRIHFLTSEGKTVDIAPSQSSLSYPLPTV